ncbi:hypothetical protein A500_10155 [Clostridium sartagoforme AAU1]|uniref:Uncharacterized protein n=1 Tax=Clostridium sartagoforme AAU1 TaxID=1202534 RepID=R9C7T6_9CLOT|nr:hypothetical protein A500_10155 [Clostridium sartagoforme AAU1]
MPLVIKTLIRFLPETPKISVKNVDSLNPACCRDFSIRFFCVLISSTIFFLYLVNCRSSLISAGGMKLPVKRPARSKVAIHSKSLISVF